MNEKIQNILTEIESVIVGKNENVEKILMAILAQGHVLMEDVPGVGKTTTALTFAKVLGLDTRRVQFTSDTVPSDVIGYSVYDKKERFSAAVERRSIQTPVATYDMLDGQIGYIKIANFDSRCAEETNAAMDALLTQGAKALIFDVRNNGGGYKDELVKVLDKILPEGILFQSEDYQGTKQSDRSDERCIELPMAVLVNQDSYSAAEFFAAAIQEYGWGTVVGTKTVGKGNFQTAFTLSDGSMLNLSIGKYYTPQGRSLTDTGVTPDVIVELSEENSAKLSYGRLEKADDAQLQAAIREITQKLS